MRVLVVSGSRAELPDPVYPLGAAIVATEVRRAGHEVSWFDALRHKEPQSALAELLATARPEAVLMSLRNIDSAAFPAPARYYEDHLPLVRIVRQETHAPIILGGSAFSLMPDALLKHLKAEHGITGSGEDAVVPLLEALSKGRGAPSIISGGKGSGSVPVADRDLFDAAWYYERGGVANLQTKRGCAMRCIYCTYPLLEGARPSLFEPREVVEEMASIVDQGIRHFFFVDAVFNAPESHAAQVCEEIIRRELDISFTAYFVPRCHSREFPVLLKRAGCTAAELGTDALSDTMLESYKKGFTVDDVVGFSEMLAEQQIPQCHNLILGGPGETPSTMEESVRRMDTLEPTAVIVTLGLRVFPGTELARIGDQKQGLGDGAQLDPVFYIEEAVAGDIIERAAAWIAERQGWICPGLQMRCNPRYLKRLRMHRNRKGVLWTIFKNQ